MVGQVVLLKTSSTRTTPALVTHVNSGDNINLVAAIDNSSDWPDPVNVPSSHPTWLYESVDKGTGVGEWQDATVPVAVTDAISTAADGRLANAGAPTSAGLTLGGSGVQLSSTRPTRLNARLTASMTSTLLGPQNYTVELRCDSGSTPTTVVDDASGALSGVAATTDQPAKLSVLVPAGHYCRIVTSAASANATVTLVAATKQVL